MALTEVSEDLTGPRGGMDGTLSLGGEVVANLRNFKWNITGTTNKFRVPGSQFKKTTKGPSEWAGSADFYLEQEDLLALESGKLYAFQAKLLPDADTPTPIEATVRLKDIEYNVDVENGEPNSGSLTFEGHGDPPTANAGV